ncbi:cytochrome c oxidase assembly protein COX16-like protein [Huso huso]|uniref:Cytochrome c oxidase assembly protein COX16 homolog, mitochondrial n=1 Tax=Huso huso TaxID=61971 RepID=A0ABR0Z358_HUSHU
MWNNWKALQRNKTARYGIPMLLDPALKARVSAQKQKVTLETEYEKLKELNLEDWRNIRGPRPWEDSRQYQEQQRSQQAAKQGREL